MSEVEQSVQSHHTYPSQEDEGLGRYSAYAVRLRTLLTSGSRYIAYSSDIGEAFRPLTRPSVVRTAYAVSWAYIFGDVGYTCYKYCEDRDTSLPQLVLAYVLLTFQLTAAAITIHSVVKYSSPIFARSRFARVRGFGPTVAGLLVVPLLPSLFDEPVEMGVDHSFDLLELKYAAYNGNQAAQKVLDQKLGRLKNLMGLGNGTSSSHNTKPAPDDGPHMEKRPVDEIGSATRPELALKTPSAQLALLGVGVDLVYLPRMRNLVARHAKRLTNIPWQGALAMAPRLAIPQRQEETSTSPNALAAAAQHFARRTLSKNEADMWSNLSCMTHEDRLRFLATRWACKEATYKAVYPHIRLSARDVSMERGTSLGIEKPRVVLNPAGSFRSALGEPATEVARATQLHLSVAHDGEYVLATVVAETR